MADEIATITEIVSGEVIAIGRLEEFPDSKTVVSKSSNTRQNIPIGSRFYRDFLTNELESV